ncbi:MAG TPA: hypothetical protein VGE16_04780 [Albitalea sp.]
MRSTRWLGAAVLAAAGAAATNAAAMQGDGLVPSPESLWPRWQARLSLGTSGPLLHPDTVNADSSGLKVSSASLFGDYYFSRSMRAAGSGGGFRATSGLIVGSRTMSPLPPGPATGLGVRAFSVGQRHVGGLQLPAMADDADNGGPVPYVGVGYSALLGKGSWGFSADVGVMALGSGSAVKLGRVFTGHQSLDDAVREMRLSPLLQLGVSYSF